MDNFRTYDKHYKRMGNKPLSKQEIIQGLDTFLVNSKFWLPSSKDAKILDFGCGWGDRLGQLWAAGYKNIEGVEIVECQASYCREVADGCYKITCCDATDYLRSTESPKYDLVILSDVLEHISVSEVTEVLKVINSSLNENGRLYIRTPNMSCFLASYCRYMDFTHVAGYTEFSLMQLLELAGFETYEFLPEKNAINLKIWRPWFPLRGFGIRSVFYLWLHKLVYWMKGINPKPKFFDYNLQAIAYKQ